MLKSYLPIAIKNLTLSFSLFCLIGLYHPITAQTVEDDFEGNGTINTWFGDACNINVSLANPVQQGINTSASVLEYHDVGGQYANVRFDVPMNFDLSSNHTFTLKIFVPSSGITGNAPNQVSLKLQNGTIGSPWTTQCEITKQIQLNQWQSVSFDFLNDTYSNLDPSSLAPTQRTDFNRVLIQVNGENNTDMVIAYIDDVLYDGTLPTPPVYTNLIWADEFNSNGPIDTAKWFHQTQLPINGSWYNGEIQHYTNRTVNTFVSNDALHLVAKKETFTDQGHTKNYTSARLNSKFAFQYGRIEVRAILPTGVGTWPAIWMLGKNIDENGGFWDNSGFGTTPWPACGEIDIMEHWGNNQNYVQSAIHTPSSFGGTVNLGGQTVSTASTAFHVYTLDWSPNKLVFSVDNVVHYTYNPSVKDANTWPFDDELYILLNIAIQPSIDPNFTEDDMVIDYVRVYQASGITIDENKVNKSHHLYPNPVQDKLMVELGNTTMEKNAQASIYNAQGQLLYQNNIEITNNRMQLTHLDFLQNGFYTLVFDVGESVIRLKFIKN